MASTFSTLHINRLTVKFKDRTGLPFGNRTFSVVRDINLEITANQTVCLLGESGSGKTTLAWSLLGLHPFHGGGMAFNGQPIEQPGDKVHQKLRSCSQMIFQNPAASLDPYFSLKRSITEPLIARGVTKRARAERLRELADQTGIASELLERRPSEVSGGQSQRACIARALSTRPAFLILDEPLTALDAIAQRQLVELLRKLKENYRLTYFLITHDMALARRIGTHVAVMYLGRIVETAPSEAFFANPFHPYAKALLSSALTPGVWEGPRIVLTGEAPSVRRPPAGCTFHPRCPWKMPICQKLPPVKTDMGGGHRVACHLYAKRAGEEV